jgi:hypothetical protein
MSRSIELPVVSVVRSEAPLVIRGHNILKLKEYYVDLINGVASTPEEHAQASIGMLRLIGEPEYVVDVLGRDPEHESVFKAGVASVYKRFITLPNKHRVELVEGMRDDICAVTAVGRHCGQYYDGGLLDDREALNEFIWCAPLAEAYFQRPLRYSVESIFARFTDNPGARVRKIKTTVGVLRDVIDYTS